MKKKLKSRENNKMDVEDKWYGFTYLRSLL
jgi:hypothetical protein